MVNDLVSFDFHVVQITSKSHGQRDLSLWLTSSRVDPLKHARFFEVSVRNLQLLDHGR